MKLLLSAVMFSPNIGDGVIAECFRAAAPPAADIDTLDLAGRTGYVTRPSALRHRILTLLAALPAPLSDQVSQQLVRAQIRRAFMPLLPGKLKDVDGLLIGGGQLLADANMNFPLKIHRLVSEAQARNVPFAIHSVGVAARWSPPARALFQQVLNSPNLQFLSVRDARSQANLIAHFADMGLSHLNPPQVFPDPGFLSAPMLLPNRPSAPRPTQHHIGLGVTHPTALALHGGMAGAESWAQWYAATARALLEQGRQVTLFTNGAFEDETCLAQTMAHLQDLEVVACQRAPRPGRPTELVQLISGFDAVISHRLHASIVAYSCGIAPVGLRWDKKLEGFFDLIKHPANLMKETQPTPEDLLKTLAGAPVDMAHHARICGAAQAGITAAVSAFERSA